MVWNSCCLIDTRCQMVRTMVAGACGHFSPTPGTSWSPQKCTHHTGTHASFVDPPVLVQYVSLVCALCDDFGTKLWFVFRTSWDHGPVVCVHSQPRTDSFRIFPLVLTVDRARMLFWYVSVCGTCCWCDRRQRPLLQHFHLIRCHVVSAKMMLVPNGWAYWWWWRWCRSERWQCLAHEQCPTGDGCDSSPIDHNLAQNRDKFNVKIDSLKFQWSEWLGGVSFGTNQKKIGDQFGDTVVTNELMHY